MFDDLIPASTQTLSGFDDLIPQSQFSNVQSGAESAAAPEKGFLGKAAESIAEIPEGLYEGTQAGLSNMGGWLTRAATAPAIAFDAAKSAVTGELTTDAQDWMFGNLVDPYKKNEEAYQAELKQKGLPGQIAGGVGQALPDVGLAIASGGVAGAGKTLAETGGRTLARMIADSAGMGIKTAAPLAEKAAGERYAQAIAEGKSVGEATSAAIKAIATTTAMGLTGSGGVGRLGNTVASGLSGEAVREMEGRPFDPAELGTNLALGFGLSGPKQDGPRAPEISARDADFLNPRVESVPDTLPIPEVAPTRSPMEQRMAEFGLFDDLVPQEGTQDTTQAAQEATGTPPTDTQLGRVLPDTQSAPDAIQSDTAPIELSPTALRIKEANEQSLRDTGKPISADQIRSIRQEEPTGSFDLWEDTVAELKLPKVQEVRSKDSVLQELKDSFGSDFAALDRAMQSGKFKILDGTEMPDWVKAKNLKTAPRGWRDAEGNVAIVADKLEPGYVRPLIFHEIGVHAGIQQSKNYDRVLSNVHRLVEQDNADAMRAVGRMQAQKAAGNKLSPAKENQELVAYFVQGIAERMQAGESITSRAKSAYGKIKADLKNLLNDRFGLDIQLTDKDMYYMALGEIRKFGDTPSVKGADPNFALGAAKQPTQDSEATPTNEKITPEVFRRLSSILSWKGGNKFANEFERAKLEGATGDFLAQRSAALFDKAGFKKLSDNQKEVVRAALNGDKAAEAALSPKAREAVRFTRDEITNYQSQLAGMGVKMDGKDLSGMLYDSMAKDDYTTRAYGVYEIKPTSLEEIRYAVSSDARSGKPFWRWRQEKHNPQAVKGLTDYIEKNLIDPNSNRSPQEQVEDLLNQLADPKGFSGSNVEVVRQAARDSSILKARENVPKPIREYWGEFKDPRLQAAYTLSRLGTLTAKQGLLTRLAKEGDGKHFFEEGSQPKGYTAKLPENSDYGPLAGKMTRPDIARQLESQVGIEKATPGHIQNQVLMSAFDHYANLSAKAKVAKTVLSFATGAVNAMANVSLVAKVSVQHALMGQFLGIPDFAKASSAIAKDFLGKLDTETGKMLISKGIIRDSAQYGELRKVRSRIEREAAREGSGKVAGAASKVADAGANVFQKIADLYQTPDNFSRAMFFFGEMTIQKKLHPKWTEQQVIEYAANKARDEVPTWGRASPTVKATSRAMGNFATWSGEVIRSYKNQVKNATNDMVHGETPAIKYYGFSQLAATSASIALAQTLVPAVISSMFGFDTDDKKKNEAVSKLAPEYFGGDTLSVADADPKSGKIVFLNSTRLDPSAPFHQLWNREMSALKEDRSIPEATWGWIKDSFLTPGPAPQAVGTAVTGKDKFDRALAPDERAKAVVDAFKPGSAVTLEKIEKLKKRSVDQRVIDATKVGLPLYELDTSRAMTYATMDFSESVKDYRAQFNRGYGAADATPEDQKSKYAEFLKNEKEAFDKLQRQVKALQTIFGEKEGKEIALDAFKEAKLDKDYLRAIEKGTFVPNPIEDSKTFLDRQERNAIYADPSREKEIRKDFNERRQQLTRYRRNYQSLLDQ